MFVSALLFAATAAVDELNDPSAFQRIAAEVNAKGSSWKADPEASSIFKTPANAQALCGTFLKGDPRWVNHSLPEYNGPVTADVPDEFDARTKWPKCTVISKVRNQAGCGSCWAFGATESFEGSRCASTGEDTEFSADDTAACSGWFGSGCGGGQPEAAQQWFTSKGVVTGGEYQEDNGCLPYVCPPCKDGLYPPKCPTDQCSNLLKCTKACTNKDYKKSYADDKTKAQSAFSAGSVSKMQNALMTTGPLAVTFSVYGDFPTYSSGVYKHTSGSMLGGHAVVAIGWGTDNGQDYWLIKNSWTAQWGNKGYFKIARGTNECGIESGASGNSF